MAAARFPNGGALTFESEDEPGMEIQREPDDGSAAEPDLERARDVLRELHVSDSNAGLGGLVAEPESPQQILGGSIFGSSFDIPSGAAVLPPLQFSPSSSEFMSASVSTGAAGGLVSPHSHTMAVSAASIHGHPSDQFLELDKLEAFGVPVKCAICTEVLKNATETSCHHLFCNICINTSLRSKAECPVCRTKPLNESDLRPSGAIDRMILQQKVYCPNRLDAGGCHDWVGSLSDVRQHLGQCAFQPVECNDCHRMVVRGELDKHNHQCPLRRVHCLLCQQSMPFRNLRLHQQKECEMGVVPCPQGCEISGLVRRDVQAHLADECRLQTIACPYKDIGCAATLPRAQMEVHRSSESEPHLALMMSAFLKQRRQIQSMAAVVERLRDRVQETKAELCASKRRELQHARILANMRALPSTTTHVIRVDDLKAKARAFPTGTFWESPPFETPGGGRWALRCYLNGWTESDKEDIGVFLSASNNTDPVITIRTMYTITLTDPFASVTFEKCYRDEFWGAPSFVPRADIVNRDSIVFQIELKVLGIGEDEEEEEEQL